MLHDEVCIQFFPRSCIIVADRKLNRAWYCIGMRAARAKAWGGSSVLVGVSRVNTECREIFCVTESWVDVCTQFIVLIIPGVTESWVEVCVQFIVRIIPGVTESWVDVCVCMQFSVRIIPGITESWVYVCMQFSVRIIPGVTESWVDVCTQFIVLIIPGVTESWVDVCVCSLVCGLYRVLPKVE